MERKKYGLQLRVQSQQKKQHTKPPLPTPLGFNDEDDDNIEREILRQAHKNKTHKDVEEQHKKALEEDPSVFDYDGVFEQMKEEQVRPKAQEHQDRKPRYIQTLINKAKQREREHEIIYERKLAKERSQDEHMYSDKEKFVTSAYKKKLAEQAKWLEEERLRELREEKEDVTKKTDITDFYFNLSKNVAYGATDVAPKIRAKQPEQAVGQASDQASAKAVGTDSPSTGTETRHQDETAEIPSPKENPDHSQTKPVSDTTSQDQATNDPCASTQPPPDNEEGNENAVAAVKDHHKRSEDAVAAAKARYLARKKAKV